MGKQGLAVTVFVISSKISNRGDGLPNAEKMVMTAGEGASQGFSGSSHPKLMKWWPGEYLEDCEPWEGRGFVLFTSVSTRDRRLVVE